MKSQQIKLESASHLLYHQTENMHIKYLAHAFDHMAHHSITYF